MVETAADFTILKSQGGGVGGGEERDGGYGDGCGGELHVDD